MAEGDDGTAPVAGSIPASPPPLFKHQAEGIRWLVGREYGMLGDEMRLGKTRQVIEAAQQLYCQGEIDSVLVIAPAPVRDEWFDPEFGQLARYRHPSVPFLVTKYQAKPVSWKDGGHLSPGYRNPMGARVNDRKLQWIVTNYELIRRPDRLAALLPFCDKDTLLVLDESLAVKSPRAEQTKACWKIRVKCGRVWALNGTPEGDNPGDAFAQYQVLSTDILSCKNWFHFRARYGVMGGWKGKQVVAWTNLEDLRRRTSPHTLRRVMADVFDMPAALEPTVLTAPLSPRSWELYQDMKKEAVAWLDENHMASAAQAGVRVLRLAQITSGFLGGVSGDDEELPLAALQPIGTEKHDAFLEWLEGRLVEDPRFKVVVWCRFRAEAERIFASLDHPDRPLKAALLYGGQKPEARTKALHLLHPNTSPAAPVVVVGTAKTGGFGLNFAAASSMVYVSTDYSLVTRRQSQARILGPDQKKPAMYVDVVATGPDGQKTVDHAVLKALRKKVDVATWTAGDWARALKEE